MVPVDARGRVGVVRRSTRSGPLAEPAAGFLVAEDARVPARLQHEVEVAAVERSSVHQRSTTRHSSRTSATPSRFTCTGTPTGLASTSAGRGALILPAALREDWPQRTCRGQDPSCLARTCRVWTSPLQSS